MYYFLDVDGVLNRQSDWRKPFTVNRECVRNFRKLIDNDDNPHIILSSTWRQGFTNTGLTSPRADNLTEIFHDFGIEIEGVTPVSNKTRQEEIEYYIRRNGVSEYIVLDDDESLFPRPDKINLFLTDFKMGLTEADVETVLKMNHRIKKRK